MSEEQRRAPRASCDHKATFAIGRDGQATHAFQAKVADVSSLGARIVFEGVDWASLSWIESRVGLLTIEIAGQKLELRSKVVWAKPEPLEAGLFFTQHEELEYNDAFNEFIAAL
jgi:hypothetical protein